MKRCNSYQQILEAVNSVKSLKKGFITNLYPDEQRLSSWISNDLFYIGFVGDSVYFLKKNDTFFNLFFCTTNIDSLQELLKYVQSNCANTLIADIIGNDKQVQPIIHAFSSNNFFRYTSLYRMSKPTSICEVDEKSDSIKSANSNKNKEVLDLLYHFFDPLAEQLPVLDEIDNWIKLGHLLVYEENNQILGFLIYDLVGYTSYLRYWFVHPEHREKKIGSLLLREFFANSKDTKRQLFWVIQSNENAIKRYVHYGFIRENMLDYIMINKKIQYENSNN